MFLIIWCMAASSGCISPLILLTWILKEILVSTTCSADDAKLHVVVSFG